MSRTFFSHPDTKFLIQVAQRILGASNVATVTTETLTRLRVDKERLAQLLRAGDGPVLEVAGYDIKRIDGDPDSPDTFGVLVRRGTVDA